MAYNEHTEDYTSHECHGFHDSAWDEGYEPAEGPLEPISFSPCETSQSGEVLLGPIGGSPLRNEMSENNVTGEAVSNWLDPCD